MNIDLLSHLLKRDAAPRDNAEAAAEAAADACSAAPAAALNGFVSAPVAPGVPVPGAAYCHDTSSIMECSRQVFMNRC